MTDQLTRIERKLNLLLEQKETVENIYVFLEKLQEQIFELQEDIDPLQDRILTAIDEFQRKLEGKPSKLHGGFS